MRPKVVALMIAAALLVAASAGAGQALRLAGARSGQAAKTDVTGKWSFNVETGAGSGTPTITLKQDGEKLTGHYSGQLGEADLTGTIKGSEFTFKFTVDAQGNMLECTYQGTAESKDSLKGKLDIAGLANGTFTAKKQ